MLTKLDVHRRELTRTILSYAAGCPTPRTQAQADTNARLELKDIEEQQWSCETDDEKDAILRKWMRLWT